MSPRDQNLDALRAWARRLRSGPAAEAVHAGQAVIADGLRRRCPVGATHELRDSIHATPVVATPRGVRGSVEVGTDHALSTEYGTATRKAEPFVRPTVDVDGPAAVAAMADTLRRLT